MLLGLFKSRFQGSVRTLKKIANYSKTIIYINRSNGTFLLMLFNFPKLKFWAIRWDVPTEIYLKEP